MDDRANLHSQKCDGDLRITRAEAEKEHGSLGQRAFQFRCRHAKAAKRTAHLHQGRDV